MAVWAAEMSLSNHMDQSPSTEMVDVIKRLKGIHIHLSSIYFDEFIVIDSF